MTKTQQAINYLKHNVHFGRTIDLMKKYETAMEVDCSISTVNRAVAQMRADGLVDENNVFTGRTTIAPRELAAKLQHETILTDAKYAELAREFCAEVMVVTRSVYYAVRMGFLTELNGGSYGYMVRAA